MRPVAAMLVALALGIAGCGGGDKQPASTAAQPPGQSQQQPPASPRPTGPHGHLTNEEYRAIVREYRRFDALRSKLDGAKPGDRVLQQIEAVCSAVDEADTALVALVSQDCRNAIANRDNTGELDRATQKCRNVPRAQLGDCAARAYVAFAGKVSKTLGTALRINKELSSRGIYGVCQTSIGVSPEAAARLKAEIEAADTAADALRAGDGDAFSTAVDLLKQALLAQSAESDPLPGIVHDCPHAAAKATPKAAPKPKPKKTTPHKAPPKPRLQQPGDPINI